MDATLRIEIFPADLARSIAFYERLGFETSPPQDGYAYYRLGTVRIGALEQSVFGPERVEPSARHNPRGTEIVIEVDDVAATHDTFVAVGVEVTEGLQERPWGLTDFRLHDPDGYYLRFTSRATGD